MAKPPSFQDRRKLARNLFGTCTIRPQESSKEFLLLRRRINYNINFSEPVGHDEKVCHWAISKDLLNINRDIPEPTRNPPPPILVNDASSFAKMMKKLTEIKTVMLDLEGNDEDCYAGMTCLVQLATSDEVYLVDPFSTSTLLRTELKSFLEREDIIIVTHGCVNDMRWLKRDFGIFPVAVVDVQLIYQSIHRGDLIGFDKLLKIMAPDLAETEKNKKVLQMADWRLRPLPITLQRYAQMDVYGLLYVWEEFKKQDPDGFHINHAVLKTKEYLKKPPYVKTLKPFGKELETMRKTCKLTTGEMETMQCLWEFRNFHAKAVDAHPSQLISMKTLVEIVKMKPTSQEELGQLVRANQILLRKSFGTILKLLEGGKSFLDKIKFIQCNNCLRTGHAAFACWEVYANENVYRWYKLHPELKTKRNRNKRQNYKKNQREKRQANK